MRTGMLVLSVGRVCLGGLGLGANWYVGAICWSGMLGGLGLGANWYVGAICWSGMLG
ncbi:hypothetical protein [Paenibacillus sp. WC2504]